jgi:hypothetical protein
MDSLVDGMVGGRSKRARGQAGRAQPAGGEGREKASGDDGLLSQLQAEQERSEALAAQVVQLQEQLRLRCVVA